MILVYTSNLQPFANRTTNPRERKPRARKRKKKQEGGTAWRDKGSRKENVEGWKEGATANAIIWVCIRLKYVWFVPFNQAVADASNKLKWAIGLMPGLDTMSGAKLCPQKKRTNLTGVFFLRHFILFTIIFNWWNALWQFLKVSLSLGVVYLSRSSKASSFNDYPKCFLTWIGLRAEKYAQSVREDVEEKKHDLEAVTAFHHSNTNDMKEAKCTFIYFGCFSVFLLFLFGGKAHLSPEGHRRREGQLQLLTL